MKLFLTLLFTSFWTVLSAQTKPYELVKIANNSKESDSARLEALYLLSFRTYLTRNEDSAVYFAEKHLALARKVKNKKSEALAINSFGVINTINGNYAKALEFHSQSKKIREEIADFGGLAGSYSNMGNVYSLMNNPTKALENYQFALDYRKKIADQKGIAQSCINIGTIYLNTSQPQQAVAYFKLGLTASEELKDELSIAKSLNAIGKCYGFLQEYEEGINYLKKSLVLYEKHKRWSDFALTLQLLGNIYYDQSDLANAYDAHSKSLKIYEALEDLHACWGSLLELGNVFLHRVEFEKALDYYHRSLLLSEKLGNKMEIARSLNNVGITNLEFNKYQEAQDCFKKMITIGVDLRDSLTLGQAHHNLGRLHYSKGDSAFYSGNQEQFKFEFELAADYYLKSAVFFKAAQNQHDLLTAYRNLAIVYNGLGEVDKSKEYLFLLRDNSSVSKSFSSKLFFLKIQLAIQMKSNEWQNAYTTLNELLQHCENSVKLNFNVLSEKEKEKYLIILLETVDKYNSFGLLQIDKKPEFTSELYNLNLKMKGYLLKSGTSIRKTVLESNDQHLINLYNEWMQASKNLASLYAAGTSTKEEEEKVNTLEKEVTKKASVLGAHEQSNITDWKAIQNALLPNEVAIEFISFEQSNLQGLDIHKQIIYCALLVRKNSSNPVLVKICAEKELERILKGAKGSDFEKINKLYNAEQIAKTELHDVVWKPLKSHLKGVKTIFISPAGLLHRISFPAIPTGKNAYLSDQFSFQLLSSTASIVNKNKFEWTPDLNVSLFGGIDYNIDTTAGRIWNYLPGTKTEVEGIAKLLSSKKINSQIFSGKNGTETNFKNQTFKADILHVATHGFFFPDPAKAREEQLAKVEIEKNIQFRGTREGFGVWSFVTNKNPLMRSGLVFAQANRIWISTTNDSIDDGILTAQELSTFDLRKTQLIVLSACETGLGDISGSEGVYGLQRSLKMAGAKFMLISLWQVPDKESEEFMLSFYSKLLKGVEIRQAFSKTQNEMRKKYSPYYWAAFVLVE